MTVLDVTPEYVRAGRELTRRVGLSDRVQFRHGSAVLMPFPEQTFDLAWTQHATMNIEDQEQLYREIHRVLRPGGRLASHEVMAGPGGPIYFPVPWAREPSISFLRQAEDVRGLIADAGFRELAWVDQSAASLEWFRRRLSAPAASISALGPHLLLGDDFGTMVKNQFRNLTEGRIAVIMSVWERV